MTAFLFDVVVHESFCQGDQLYWASCGTVPIVMVWHECGAGAEYKEGRMRAS